MKGIGELEIAVIIGEEIDKKVSDLFLARQNRCCMNTNTNTNTHLKVSRTAR